MVRLELARTEATTLLAARYNDIHIISYLIANQCIENINILNHKHLLGEDEVCWGERTLPAGPML